MEDETEPLPIETAQSHTHLFCQGVADAVGMPEALAFNNLDWQRVYRRIPQRAKVYRHGLFPLTIRSSHIKTSAHIK